MKSLSLFILCVISSSILCGQCVNNPSVQAGDLDPAPLYPEVLGQASFTYFENLLDYADWENDPVKMTVCFLHTTPLEGAASVTGTASDWFDWLYDPISNCLLATQNRTILGGTGGSIDVEFDITSPVECGTQTNQMGFIVNIQPAACMNSTNLQKDDIEYVYTCFDPSGTTAIKGHKLQHLNISLFPNPASKLITLEVNSDRPAQQADIIITDILGRTIKTIENEVIDQGANSIQVNINEFADGTYFLIVKNEDGSSNALKFIKTK